MGQIKVRTLMVSACQGFLAERQSLATQRRVIRGPAREGSLLPRMSLDGHCHVWSRAMAGGVNWCVSKVLIVLQILVVSGPFPR